MRYLFSSVLGLGLATLLFSIEYGSVSILLIILLLLPILAFMLLFGNKKTRNKTFILVTIFAYSFIVYLYKLYDHLGQISLDAFSITIIIYLLLQVIIAKYAPTVEPNDSFGIRTPFTLEYTVIWVKTHAFLSVVATITIPMLFILIFFWGGWSRFWIGTIVLLLPLLSSILYSNIIGIRYNKIAVIKEKEELKKQEEKEKGYYKWKE